MAKSSVSALQQFVSGFEAQSFWLGIDVHKQSYSFALRRADQRCFTWKGPADPKAVVAQVTRLGITLAVAAYESGPTGFVLARTLERANIAVIVAAPSRIPRSVTAGAKCDRLDCIKLAPPRGWLNRSPSRLQKRNPGVPYSVDATTWLMPFAASSSESKVSSFSLACRNQTP